MALSNGDRVLVKDQGTAADNGIYEFNGVSYNKLFNYSVNIWESDSLLLLKTMGLIFLLKGNQVYMSTENDYNTWTSLNIEIPPINSYIRVVPLKAS